MAQPQLATHVLLETQSLMTTGKRGPGKLRPSGSWPCRKSVIRPRTRAWSIVSWEHLEFMGSFSNAGSASPITQIAQLIRCPTRDFGKNCPWRSAASQHSLLCMLVTCCGRYLAELVCSTYCAARKQSRGHAAQILHRDGIVCDDVRRMRVTRLRSPHSAPPLEAGKKASSVSLH